MKIYFYRAPTTSRNCTSNARTTRIKLHKRVLKLPQTHKVESNICVWSKGMASQFQHKNSLSQFIPHRSISQVQLNLIKSEFNAKRREPHSQPHNAAHLPFKNCIIVYIIYKFNHLLSFSIKYTHRPEKPPQ